MSEKPQHEQQPQIVTVEPRPTAVVRGTAPMKQIADFFDRGLSSVRTALDEQGVTPSDAFGLYLSPPSDSIDLEVGFVVDHEVTPTGEVVPSRLPGGLVAKVTYQGPYDGLGQAWGQFMAWIGDQGHTPGGPTWEVYLTEPAPNADPRSMRTDLFCPLA